jgi:hypothetical protein
MKNDEKTSLLAALDALGERYSERERPADAPSAWYDGVRSARALVDELVPVEREVELELEAEVSEEELRDFPRMQAVRATILAGGGRATRSAVLQGATIVAAFVEYELRQADEQRRREESAEFDADVDEPGVVLRFEPVRLAPGASADCIAYAAEWMRFPVLDFEPVDALEISDVSVGATTELQEKIQKGERVMFRVTNRSPSDVTVSARLTGDAVPPEEQSKGL